MLNLRQLNKTDNTETNSDAHHFSRFSVDFRVPSDILGNIGEPLDHSQSEWLHEGEPSEREGSAEDSEAGPGADLESAGPVAGPSGARWGDEDRALMSTAGAVAGPSVMHWDDDGPASLERSMPTTGTPGARSDKVGGASHTSDYVDGVDTGEEVRLSFHSYRCCPRPRIVSFAGAKY